MGVRTGETGIGVVGPLKTFTFSASKQETFLETNPITIGPSETGTPLVSYTVRESDLPQISPAPYSSSNIPVLYVAGKMGAVASSISLRIYLNGVSIMTGNTASIAANNSWTLSIVHTNYYSANSSTGVQVGDIISIELWCTQSVVLDFHGFVIYPGKVYLTKPGVFLKDVQYGSEMVDVYFTLGRRVSPNMNSFAARPSNDHSVNLALGDKLPYVKLQPSGATTFGLYTPAFGDSNYRTTNFLYQNANYHPYYQINRIPTTVSFRELNI